MFNKFFRNKVEKLRRKTDQTPVINPADQLKKWLFTRSLPLFELKEIDKKKFRMFMKKMV